MKSIGVMIFFSMFFGSVQAGPLEKTPLQLCSALDQAFKKRNWGKESCSMAGEPSIWKVGGTSVKGRPLIYAVFGRENAKNTTLIFSMVHSDEITPLYLGFQMAAWAKENMGAHPDSKLIIAPLVNPDGFLDVPKTRTNARGVDCNRNFATQDWHRDALRSWKVKFHSEKRRFPGYQPNSEPETLFQKMLIERFDPDKILSIHSPLNVVDYDGPDQVKIYDFSKEYIEKCEELRKKVKARSTGFFPGSLGNYSGQDLGIPTITLELPSARPEKAKEYWDLVKKGFVTVINHVIDKEGKE